MTDRRALREAYKRLSTNQCVTPAELHRTVEQVTALCRRDVHFAWLRHVAEERRRAVRKLGTWEFTPFMHSARNCLDYARQTRAATV